MHVDLASVKLAFGYFENREQRIIDFQGCLMEKFWVRWFVCVLLFLSGGVFFKLIPHVSFNFDLKLGWEAFSAMGTIAAVIVSLYMARSSDRNRKAEKKEISSLVAARLWPITQALHQALIDLSVWVYLDDLDSSEPISDIRESVKHLRIYLDRISINDIEQVVYIDIVTASYLSRSIGEIGGVIASVERESKEWIAIPQRSKEFYRSHWGGSLTAAQDFLFLVLPNLEKAAQRATPSPDWAAVYGEAC